MLSQTDIDVTIKQPLNKSLLLAQESEKYQDKRLWKALSDLYFPLDGEFKYHVLNQGFSLFSPIEVEPSSASFSKDPYSVFKQNYQNFVAAIVNEHEFEAKTYDGMSHLKQVKSLAIVAAWINRKALECFSSELKGDLDVMLMALYHDATTFELASNELKVMDGLEDIAKLENEDERQKRCIDFYQKRVLNDESPQKNYDICLEKINISGLLLPFMPDEYKEDYSMISSAINSCGLAIQSVPAEYHSNKTLALLAIAQHPHAYQLLPQGMRDERLKELSEIKDPCQRLECCLEACNRLLSKSSRK